MNMRILLTVGFLMSLGVGVARAVDAPIERMEASTVRVLSKIEGGYETGSGFLVGDGTYVVTNHHVIADTQGIAVLAKAFRKRVSRIVIDSPEKDLAVLQLEDGIGRPSVVLGLSSGVKKTETVLAAGFPGAADNQGDSMDNFLEVKFSQGIISGYVKSPNGEALYQISAALNPGNSGGPLFDECGRVIGINVEKSLTQAVTIGPGGRTQTERVPLGEGIGWSIESDELVALLRTAGISTQVATSECVPGSSQSAETTMSGSAQGRGTSSGQSSSGSPSGQSSTGTQSSSQSSGGILWSLAVVFVIGIVVALIVVFSGRNQRPGAQVAQIIAPPPLVLPPLPPGPDFAQRSIGVAGQHKLRGLSGTFSNASFPLSYEPITMGRNPRLSQIVFKESDNVVSKRHCTVRVDRGQGGVVVEDCNSSNGTFLENGERLTGGQPRLVRSGGKFYLGDRSNLFQVD